MFGRRKLISAPIKTIVGPNTRIDGNLEFSEGCLVDGSVFGSVTGLDEKSLLNLSEDGIVEGDVEVANVMLNGTVTGDVFSTERVLLGPKSRVTGNVHYRLMEMAIGAEVSGKLIHESDAKAPLAVRNENLAIRRVVGE